MNQLEQIEIMFVAGFGPITQSDADSKAFYIDALELPLKPMPDNERYRSTENGDLAGVKHFALWPLDHAAQSCFGSPIWPNDLVVPQSWVEFEVVDISTASKQLAAQGYTLLVNNRIEPWGQTVTRLQSPEGSLVGLTRTPWLRDDLSQ